MPHKFRVRILWLRLGERLSSTAGRKWDVSSDLAAFATKSKHTVCHLNNLCCSSFSPATVIKADIQYVLYVQQEQERHVEKLGRKPVIIMRESGRSFFLNAPVSALLPASQHRCCSAVNTDSGRNRNVRIVRKEFVKCFFHTL